MNETVKDDGSVVVTVNGGSSSIKFAVFAVKGKQEGELVRILSGSVERIGLPGAMMTVKAAEGAPKKLAIEAATQRQAAKAMMKVLHERVGKERIVGIGHRVVHGGVHLVKSQVVTAELVKILKEAQPLDLAHLPGEIALIEAFGAELPNVKPFPQVACFDTAFHDGMPRVAKLLGIPRHYLDAGVRRLGFHGLSYAYLMRELERVAGMEAAQGKVILAHLGSGASMAAVANGKPMDTTMAFTPTGGLMMGTRPGDIDPGLLVYLMRSEKKTAKQMDDFISRECGLLGVSGGVGGKGSSDMRDLLARRGADVRAAEAVELFCYTARKWIGALATTMGGLDTLVFSAGIGEHSPEARAGICSGLEFLGVRIDGGKNDCGEAVISPDGSGVTVRIIATDEEIMIARDVCEILGLN